MRCCRWLIAGYLACLGFGHSQAAATTTKPTYAVGEHIVVLFDALEGSGREWVRSQPPTARSFSLSNLGLIRGQRQGTVTFPALPPGSYEVRVFDSFGTGSLQPRFTHRIAVEGVPTTAARAAAAATTTASTAGPHGAAARQGSLERATDEIRRSGLPNKAVEGAAIEGLRLAIKLASSEPMQRFAWKDLRIQGSLIAQSIIDQPGMAMDAALKAAPDFAFNVATGIAVPIAATLLTDAVFRSDALAALPPSLHAPLRALMHAALVEVVDVDLGGVSGNPSSLVEPVIRRITDIRDIYRAVGALGRTLDDGLFATALGVEAAVLSASAMMHGGV